MDEINEINEIKEMDILFDRLFPITRSITGPGLRETLDILGEYLPLDSFGLKTGTKVFDWEIPKEWVIHEGWLKGPDGEKIVDYRNHNLHVLNYSTAIDEKMPLDQLKPHLHTLPALPEAIPYVTSYYKERWGLSLSHCVFEQLEEGQYHAYIDSEHIDGELNFAHAILPGESEKEILISTYVCHPSMANNELSGPIVAAFLYNRLAKWSKRRFTYRFVFTPETIGSLSYLYQFGDDLKEKMHAGLVLTCLGGESSLSYKKSREEDTPINRITAHLFNQEVLEGSMRPFTPAFGSDERQYCSPGFNLPVGQMARMTYGQYPGYHNSLDDKETMTIEALHRSVDELEEVLQALELDGYYVNQSPYGEIKLDRYGLYPDSNGPKTRGRSTNQVADHRMQLHRILTVLNYADGKHSLLDIAGKCNCSIIDLQGIIELLVDKKLLTGPFPEERGLFE